MTGPGGTHGGRRVEQVVGRQRGYHRLGPVEQRGEDEDPETGETVIRLCNCPLKSVIAVTRRPCAAEERFVSQLVDGTLERFAYMPDGDDSCSYRIRRPGA